MEKNIKQLNISLADLKTIATYKTNYNIDNNYKKLISYLTFLYYECLYEYSMLYIYFDNHIEMTKKEFIYTNFIKINSSIYYRLSHNEVPTHQDIYDSLVHPTNHDLDQYLDDIISLVTNSYGYKIENDKLVKINDVNTKAFPLGMLNYSNMTQIILNSIKPNKEIRIKKIKGI